MVWVLLCVRSAVVFYGPCRRGTKMFLWLPPKPATCNAAGGRGSQLVSLIRGACKQSRMVPDDMFSPDRLASTTQSQVFAAALPAPAVRPSSAAADQHQWPSSFNVMVRCKILPTETMSHGCCCCCFHCRRDAAGLSRCVLLYPTDGDRRIKQLLNDTWTADGQSS